jgi:hypothetical protein
MTSITPPAVRRRARRPAVLAVLLAVVLAGLVTGIAPAGAWTTRYGRTAAPDGTLPVGCHDHRYRYVVRLRGDDWMLETFLTDRRGRRVGSDMLDSGSDPRRGRATFRVCRNTTTPGRFTIRAKLTNYATGDQVVHHFKPSHFRLRRP